MHKLLIDSNCIWSSFHIFLCQTKNEKIILSNIFPFLSTFLEPSIAFVIQIEQKIDRKVKIKYNENYLNICKSSKILFFILKRYKLGDGMKFFQIHYSFPDPFWNVVKKPIYFQILPINLREYGIGEGQIWNIMKNLFIFKFVLPM